MYNGTAAGGCAIANSNQLPGSACNCLPGFKGDITWSGGTASGGCVATRCTGTVAAPANGGVQKSRVDQHGSVATFACNDGFKLVGAASISCDALREDAPWPMPTPAPSCKGMLLLSLRVALQVATHARTKGEIGSQVHTVSPLVAVENHALCGLH